MMMPTSREQHKAWNGTVLPLNDPWWETHSPPNGFGCLCEKEFISKYEMDAGLEKTTKAPTAPDDKTNIGENWDYSIGSSDMGRYMTKAQRDELKNKKQEWISIEPNGKQSETSNDGSPLPVIENDKFAPDKEITKENFTDKMCEALGIGKENNSKVSIPFENTETGFHYETIIDRNSIDRFLNHITEGKKKKEHRERLLPMFIETLKNPSEIRTEFLRSKDTNKRAIRTYFYNRFKANGEEYMTEVVVNSGVFKEFTLWTGFKSEHSTRKGTCIFRK